MTEIINDIVNSLGMVSDELIKKKHGASPALTNKQFVEAMLSTDSIPELSRYLGIGEQTANRIIQKIFIPLLGKRTGGSDTWKLALLNNAEFKKCSMCKALLKHTAFSKDNSNFDKLDSRCKICKSDINAEYYLNNKDTYHKSYLENNRADYVARNAYRRAAKVRATPVWADLTKIKEIYKTCPAGYHVDHIYPLISDWVCGLHVEENLRHLPAEENLRKSNRNTCPYGETLVNT